MDKKTHVALVHGNQAMNFEMKLLGNLNGFQHSYFEKRVDFINAAPNKIEPGNSYIVLMSWNHTREKWPGPGMFVELVKGLNPEILIYAFSSSTNDEDFKEACSSGADGWIYMTNADENIPLFKNEYKSKLGKFHVWR